MDTNDYISSDINHQLDVCINFLETLNGNISYNANIVQWFNEFCEHLSKLILLLSEIKQKAYVQYSNYDDLLFYLNQVITCLSLLLRVLIRESNVNEILYDGRICTKKQMKWCFTGIRQFMCEDSAKSQQIGTFIKWMDAALDKISEIDYEVHKLTSLDTFKEAKILFDEVLSHAMSIAQVTLNRDYKIIRGSSQIVLESIDSLYKELTKKQPNVAMLNLFIDTCTEKLCSLEQRVNVAVLRLSLKVFSEYTDALDAIHNFCTNPINNGKLEEFDNLVVEFDLHVDRIMQIGLFALSCSTCRTSCRIRSCLASLEALESELVPAFSSILLEKTSYKINLALLLKEHWLNQAIILRKLIFLIVDPHAFCQVIYEENKELLDSINEKLKIHNSPLDRKSINKLIDQSNVMKQFVRVIMDEQLQDFNLDEVKKAFRDFKNVLHEVEAAKSILLTNGTTPNDEQRMYRRCKILLSCTKVLWNTFKHGDDPSRDDLTTVVEDNEILPSTNNPFLDHIVNKGKQIFKDCSILYPNFNSTFNIQTFTAKKITELEGSCKKNKAIPLSKLVHLRKLSFIKSPKAETSCKIEITDILNELRDLTNMTVPLESLSYTIGTKIKNS